MKCSIFIIMISCFLAGVANAQNIPPSDPLTYNQAIADSSYASKTNRERPRMCLATKAGLCAMGAGLITFYAGIRKSNDYQHNLPQHHSGVTNDPGFPICVVGGVVTFLGAFAATCGGIHDVISIYKRKHRIAIVNPTPCQLGVAYSL